MIFVCGGTYCSFLCHHGIGNLNESCYVGSFHVVDIAVLFGTVFHAGFVDV